MNLTREQAERICEEAEFQGWGQRDAPYTMTGGKIDLLDFKEHGCVVELKWPGLLGPKYVIRSTDEWRRLKAKVDEIKQIIEEARERNWPVETHGGGDEIAVSKAGSHGLMIDVYPPGTRRPYPVRVGGMRTWKKVIRDYSSIEGSVHEDILELPAGGDADGSSASEERS